MDARDVLESVARAYGGLKTLSVEILSVAESGNEDSFSRNGQRTKAWFEAPDKVRIEQGGQQGMVLVSDGVDAHSFTAHVGFPNRYSKSAAFPREFLPGLFRTEHATLGGSPPAFLFSRITDKVVSAEILAGDSAALLISVIYEQPPHSLWWMSSPVQYSVDSRTYLVSRIEGEVSMRMPAQDETTIHKHILSFVNALVDEPIAQENFQFDPPPDAVDASDPGGCGIAFGGGGGSTFKGAGVSGHFESSNEHGWEGETLIERYKLRAHGIDLSFERRLTFSEDWRELKVSERITGPKGEVTHALTLPLG